MEMITASYEAGLLLVCVLLSVGAFVGTVAVGLGFIVWICWKIYTGVLFVLGR